MVVSQAIQVVFFTAGLFAFYLAFGVIAIPDDVTVLWSEEETCPVGEPPCAGTWFGIHIPGTSDGGTHVAVRRGAVRSVLHRQHQCRPRYRERFFDPLIADVAVSLAGRDAYLDLERGRTAPG